MSLSSQPSQDDLRSYYDDNAKDHLLTYTYPWAQQRKRTTERLIQHNLPAARVLDLGCGPGTYSRAVVRFDSEAEVVGVDISERALRMAAPHPRIRYVERSWDEDLSDLGHFDLCLACEVLEHAVDPRGLLHRLRAQCDRFLVTVPIGWGVLDDPFSKDGHGHLHDFDEYQARTLLSRVDHFERDERWAYLTGL